MVPTKKELVYYDYMNVVLAGNRWLTLDVIYYEYGALVLVYTTSEKASTVFNILQDAVFDEKQLLVLLLPNIQVRPITCILHSGRINYRYTPFR